MPWIPSSFGLLPDGTFSRIYSGISTFSILVGQADTTGGVLSAALFKTLPVTISALPSLGGSNDLALNVDIPNFQASGYSDNQPVSWNIFFGPPAATAYTLPVGFLSGELVDLNNGFGNGVNASAQNQVVVWPIGPSDPEPQDYLLGGNDAKILFPTNWGIGPYVGIGYSNGTGFSNHATVWNYLFSIPTTVLPPIDLGALLGNTSTPTCFYSDDVSEAGLMVVAGYSNDGTNDHAVYWTGSYNQYPGPGFAYASGPIDLGTLPGGNTSRVNHISDNGSTMVGESNDSEGNTHAVYWDNTFTIHDLGLLSGGTTSNAVWCGYDGTNIIGYADDGVSTWGMLWTNGTPIKLLPLEGVVSPFYYQAQLVDGSPGGPIFGYGTDTDGHSVAVIWTFENPPPPSVGKVQSLIIGKRT